jgi:C-terminal processing protease CtpA/Prc
MISLRMGLLVAALVVAGCATPEDEPQDAMAAACRGAPAMTDALAMQTAIRQHMIYAPGGGVAPDEIAASIWPLVTAASDKPSHLRAIEAYVYALGDHHAHLGTNNRFSPLLIPTGAHVWVEWRDEKLVVTEMRGASVSAGLRTLGMREGTVIEKIDGVPVAEALKPPPFTPDNRDAMMGFAGRVALAGSREHRPEVTFRAPGGASMTLSMPYEAPPEPETRMSMLYPGFQGDIAEIRIHNSLGDDRLVEEFDAAMTKARAAKAIILDLRGTPSGGDSSVAKPLMAWFADGTRGYQKHESRDRTWVEQVEGRKDRYTGQVIVLVDHWTGSMGEGIAIGLRAAAGAKIVGTPMAGLRGAIDSFDLPCLGTSVRLPIEKLYEVDGTPRELAMPDVLVTPEDLAAGGGDVIYMRALELVK